MIKNQRLIRRLAGLGGAVELGRDRIMIRFPEPGVFRLVIRVAILAVAIISLPWLRRTALQYASGLSAFSAKGAVDGFGDAASFSELLRDLNDIGLFIPGTGRAVFLGNPTSRLPLLVENRIGPVADEKSAAAITDGSLNFIFAACNIAGIEFANTALRIGGIAVVPIGSDTSSSPQFKIPSNFRLIYVRRFFSTIIAVRKVADAPASVTVADEDGELRRRRTGRLLLALPEGKKEALNGLEEVALEPPAKGQLQRRLRRTRYLSDLLGDSLAEYRRRVFLDVGPPGRAGSEGWFANHYPTKDLEFEIIRVDVNEAVANGGGGYSQLAPGGGGGGIAEWLRWNVREEEYVVMKAEAETVEEMVKGRAIGLVDELFLECPNQWHKGKGCSKSQRAYWECLALYGKLRDEGVAVHQWWDL